MHLKTAQVVVVEVVLSVYIPNCSIDENGDLIVTLSDGTVMNAGKCKGEDGVDGKEGADGILMESHQL